MVQSAPPILYVNPTTGRDSNAGSNGAPCRTLTGALKKTTLGTTVQLAPGTYSNVSGEQFPLVVPQGVIVKGDEASKGANIIITGSGTLMSKAFSAQSIVLSLSNGSQLRGVTVTNPQPQGTGVWLEDSNAIVAACSLINCKREGIFVTGNARPLVTDCLLKNNAAAGITINRASKGEFRKNLCQATGYGMVISDQAAPLLVDNRLTDNRSGIVLTRQARPVLRSNRLDRNQEFGLSIQEEAIPDLGSSQSPGNNIFQDNGDRDLQNLTDTKLFQAGNQLSPTHIDGDIEFEPITVPPAWPIAATTIQTTPQPTPTPTKTPTPTVPSAGFSDATGHWAEAYIQGMVSRGLLTGFPDGTFKPEAPMTRAQYAALLAKVYDLPSVRASSSFSDLPSNFWAYGAVVKAYQMGFISGFPDGTFRPGLNLTRVQAFSSIVSGLGFKDGAASLLGIYGDRGQVPGYAAGAIATATQKQLVVNYPNPRLLNPLRDITRAEVAALVYQSLVSINRLPAIDSQYLVKPELGSLGFVDMEQHWAKDFILPLAAQSLVQGYMDGSFQPEAPVTRAQFAAWVARTFNPTPTVAAANYKDVATNHWAKNAIDQAARAQFLSADPQGNLRPDETMTRLQVIQALSQGLALPSGDPKALSRLRDGATVPAQAQPQVAAAMASKLLVNYPDRTALSPTRSITRAELAVMLYQALIRTGRTGAIASPYLAI
jgi:parallel beta-helix repeat protein